MRDPLGVQLRLRECPVVAALRRVVPGDYRSVTGCEHPALSAAGFKFAEAAVIDKGMDRSVPALFLSDAVPEKTDPVATVLRNRYNWTFVLDRQHGGGAGAASLWLLRAMDFPDRFVQELPPFPGGGSVLLMRPLKAGWLVAVQALFLKHVIKNGSGGVFKF